MSNCRLACLVEGGACLGLARVEVALILRHEALPLPLVLRDVLHSNTEISSVVPCAVDPNSLKWDPELWPNLDPDPASRFGFGSG